MRGASERRWSVGQGSAAPCRRSRRRKRRSRAGIFLLRSFPLTPRPSGPRLQTDTLRRITQLRFHTDITVAVIILFIFMFVIFIPDSLA